MALIAEYHLPCEGLPLVPVAEAVPRMTLQVSVGQPNQGGLPPFFVQATGETPGLLEDAFDNAAFVSEWARFDVTEATYQYQIIPTTGMVEQLEGVVSDPARLKALTTNRSIVKQIQVTPSGWLQKRWFADRDAFNEYRDFWRGNDIQISVERLFKPDAGPRSQDPLTESQRAAISTAYEMGYFDIPRRASLEDVAGELDISAASLSERLRRAHGRLVESYLSSDDDINSLIY